MRLAYALRATNMRMCENDATLEILKAPIREHFSKILNLYTCTSSVKTSLQIRVHQNIKSKISFHISQPKHMLWVPKRTVSMRWFF